MPRGERTLRRRCPAGGRIAAAAAGPGAVLVLAAAVLGCATYSARLADLRPQLSAGEHEKALATVDDQTGGKDALLAWLERGMILRLAERYAESNEAFAAAERTAEELYARSLSEGALSLFTNDLALSYRARPYEMSLVPFYRALNYLALAEGQSAMVEARKASLLLARYVEATLAGLERGQAGELERLRNDPFMLYFSGLLYDWDGEWNDAFIAYRNAATAYEDLHTLLDLEIPGWLGRDLERTAGWLGFGEELDQLREACPAVFAATARLPGPPADAPDPRPGGEVVLLCEAGFVPVKQQRSLQLPILKSDAYEDRSDWAWDLTGRASGARVRADAGEISYWLSVAVPYLPPSSPTVRRVEVRSDAGPAAEAVRAHHPAASARITFAAEQPLILFKTVLRGLSKYLATRQAEKQGKVLGLLTNIFGAASEVADTRSWLTLPGQIFLVRLRLPEGTHDLHLQWRDDAGRPLGSATIRGVAVAGGDWTFLDYRIF